MPAEWKKVIVSGSAAVLSQVNVGTTQQITNSQATTFLTGSFTGSFSGNGSLLTGVLATSLDIDAFGSDLTGITVLAADKLPLSDNGTEGRITVGQLATPLAGTGLEANSNAIRIAAAAAGDGLTGGGGVALAVGAGTHITVTTDAVAVNTTTLTPAISGSIFTQVSGDITILAGGVSAIGSSKVTSGMIANDTITNDDINSAAAIALSKLNLASSTIHSGSFFNGITVVSGSSQITYSGLTGIPAGIVSSSAQVLNSSGVFSGSAQITGLAGLTLTTPNIGAATGTSLVLSGDLTVNGTTTILDTTNLSVEDRFIILNHGSGSVSPSAEGGIIVEGNGTAGSGSAFFYDGDTVLRWGVALGVAEGATAVTANSYVVTVSGSAANPAGNPTDGGSAAGYGNMYVNTNDNTIWIFA